MNAQAPQAPQDRLDYLDAVRAFALLLGIVFHASMSFVPIFMGWAVMDISTSPLVGSFMLVSHSFRMELFFLIAGFFSHLTFHGKGTGEFLRSRIIRIGLPFIVGWFLLRPLLVASWIMGTQSLQGDVDILTGLKSGFLSLKELPAGIFTGSHLWFLYYLLLITALVLTVRALTRLFTPAYSRMIDLVDKLVLRISQSTWGWSLVIVPTSLCLWRMNIWGMETPDKSLVPNWPVMFVYATFFGFGWLLQRKPECLEQFAQISLSRLLLCALGIGLSLTLSGYQSNPGHPRINLLRAGFCVSYALMMWSLVALSIGLFKRFLNRPHKVVRYLADSSYWLYLIHLPIVIWLQIAVAELPWHWSFKLTTVSVLTVGISIVLYDLGVRSTFLGKILNGRRRPRVLFGWRANQTSGTWPLTSKTTHEPS